MLILQYSSTEIITEFGVKMCLIVINMKMQIIYNGAKTRFYYLLFLQVCSRNKTLKLFDLFKRRAVSMLINISGCKFQSTVIRA